MRAAALLDKAASRLLLDPSAIFSMHGEVFCVVIH
jgi:hypothetical protein